ncbi:MAG: tyrosine--tRNA ligase [candidate division NC10 bacterium]|nr:tyrosine--tRNA ligase [candidate division NC10 bacterium]
MDVEREARRQLAVLKARSVDLLIEDELYQKLCRALRTETPLRVKLGLDPTAPDLHIGHTVVIHKLREFQALGHDVIFLIGDFTGMIGDPSGRSETRKALTPEQIQENAETYKRQIFKILDPERTIIEYNSRWGKALGSEGIIKLAAQYTVARMLERDDFQKRFSEGRPISLHEFLYPLLQGYDSVALRADVELGGTDQKFNLLVGRELMRDSGLEPQVIMTLPILEGLDGTQKMSKSLGNYIGIDEPPQAMFGKAMSIPDNLTVRYMELATAIPPGEIEGIRTGLVDGSVHPRDAKERLAKALVAQYHSTRAAEDAARRFRDTFGARVFPADAPPVIPPADVVEPGGGVWIVRLVTLAGAVPSGSEARRLIRQGGVEVDGEVVRDEDYRVVLDRERRLQVGKRRFFRVLPPKSSAFEGGSAGKKFS